MYIKKLTISNFKSYGKNQILTFNKNDKILLIGNNKDSLGMQSNESGKTSLIESILWCLTGQPPKSTMNADDIIRHNTNKCEVKLLLQDENSLTIHRIRKTSGSELYFYINGELQNKQINTKSKVQQLINNYLNIVGTTKELLKDLKITNLLTYDSVENFAKSKRDKERFNFISRIFNLDKWNECKEFTREKRKEITKDLENLKSKNQVYKNLLKNNNLAELMEGIENLNNNIKKLNKKLSKLNNEYDKVKSKSKLISEYKDKLKRKDKLNSNIKTLNNEINILKGKLLLIKETGLESKLDTLNDKINNTSTTISTNKNNIKNLNKEIKNLKNNIKQSFKCPDCSSDLMIIENSIKSFNISQLKKTLEKTLTKRDNLKDNQEKLNNKYTTLKENKKILLSKIKQKQQNKTNKKLIKNKISYKNNFKEEINNIISKLKNYNNFNEQYIKTRKKELQNEIEKINKEISKSLSLKGEYKNKIESYKKAEEVFNKHDKEIKKKETLLNGFNFWYNNFPEIKRMIIQSTLPNIENITNKYLQQMEIPLEVKLSTLKETKTTGNKKQAFNIKIYDKIEDKLDNFYNRSMGGRKRIGIALCFALQEIKSNNLDKWFNFKILDELLENLDDIGQDIIYNIIIKMPGQFIVTSHNNQLKDKFNKIIKIEKENGISKIIN